MILEIAYYIINLIIQRVRKVILIKSAMFDWVHHTRVPFVGHVREKENLNISDEAILIMDGLKAYSSPEVDEILQINYIRVIFLPSHSSHIWQPLDVLIFCLVKKYYKMFQNKHYSFSNKFSHKIDRILEAWRRVSYAENIISAWRKACFEIIIVNGLVVQVSVNITKVVGILNQHSCDFRDEMNIEEWSDN